QCWQIYSSITDIYTPKPDRLRDWISVPKDNGYEALHSTVMGPGGVWVEVQIRTQRMDDIAERGFAAHWKYKKAALTSDDSEFDNWLKKIREALSLPTESAIDFLDNFKLSLYTSEILVFTPKGDSRSMPNGSTALDFAYDIHTKIGNSAIAAKINHRIQPISTPIHSGDQIEIVTSDNVRPDAEWLNFVTTSKAVQSINYFLKREHQNNMERGMKLFEEELAKLKIPLAAGLIRKILPAYESATKDEFYSKVGAEIIKLDQLEKIIKATSRNRISKFWSLFINEKSKEITSEDAEESASVPTPQTDAKFIIAECCKPIPGDAVVGYKDPLSGNIYVHKSTCDELTRLGAQFGKHIIKDEIKWSQHKRMSYVCTVVVCGIDRLGLMLDLTKVITADFNTNMSEINIKSSDGVFEGAITLMVKNAEALRVLMEKMQQIEGIESVKRKVK
ncbi:MAG: ACT domain-containing protein, partial [Rikenellaceae bacterium]